MMYYQNCGFLRSLSLGRDDTGVWVRDAQSCEYDGIFVFIFYY